MLTYKTKSKILYKTDNRDGQHMKISSFGLMVGQIILNNLDPCIKQMERQWFQKINCSALSIWAIVSNLLMEVMVIKQGVPAFTIWIRPFLVLVIVQPSLVGQFHILEVDPWTRTPILADIGTFEVPSLMYITIETQIKIVRRTISDKDAVLWMIFF